MGLFYYILFTIPAFILTLWASSRVKKYFKKYSKFNLNSNLTGYDVARMILDKEGLKNIQIEHSTSSFLSDHYDPSKRVLRLSNEVYNLSSLSSIGVAAHEVGHAVQDAKNYTPLSIMNFLTPITQISSWAFNILIFAGIFLAGLFNFFGLIKIALVCLAFTVLFSIITLPVEFDASYRARRMLIKYGIVNSSEDKKIAKVLNAAALTYVASAASAIMTFLYYFINFISSDE